MRINDTNQTAQEEIQGLQADATVSVATDRCFLANAPKYEFEKPSMYGKYYCCKQLETKNN